MTFYTIWGVFTQNWVIGKKKGTVKFRLIDLDNGKSKTITTYPKEDQKKPAYKN